MKIISKAIHQDRSSRKIEIIPPKIQQVCRQIPTGHRLSSVATRRGHGFAPDPRRGADPWRRPMNMLWMVNCAQRDGLGVAMALAQNHGREREVVLTLADFSKWIRPSLLAPALRRLRAANLLSYTVSRDGMQFTVVPRYSMAT
jgi:hypothetical protein